MIRHYLKISLRNIARQKTLAVINILGLSIGIACFSLFLLYSVNEFSFDRFHLKSDNIYRVYQWIHGAKDFQDGGDGGTPMPLGPALRQDFPDVRNFVRFQQPFDQKFARTGNEVIKINMSFADRQIFSVFSFKFLSGNPLSALSDPHQVVLTKDVATSLFGSVDISGKRIDIRVNQEFEPFTVAGVIDNIPANSTLQFAVLGSMAFVEASPMGKEAGNNWHMTIGMETYVELDANNRLLKDPAKLRAFRQKYFPGELEELKKSSFWDGKGESPVSYRLQPLKKVHFDTSIGSGYGTGTAINPQNIWILIAIASGVLLIACINFTTLAIGRSAGRAKEVGIRKVIGSMRKQLIRQFLTESLLLSILSGIIGLLLANLLLPYFNELSGRSLYFSFSQYPELIWLIVVLVLLVGLIAGSYPAFILSGFKPVEVLKSKVKLGGSNFFTKSLVTFQFVISVVLIIATIIILQQLSFMRNKDLGFNKENVVMIDARGTDSKKIFPLFVQAMKSDKNIAGIAASEIGLGAGEGEMGGGYNFREKRGNVIEYPVSNEYMNVMGMKLLAGRSFDVKFSFDTVNSIVVNEAMMKELGLNVQNIVGQQIKIDGPAHNDKTIIGVVKNFNFEPLTRQVRPQIFSQSAGMEPVKFFIRLKPGNISNSIAGVAAAWKKLVPDIPFTYNFLDTNLDHFYHSEKRWSNIIGWAGGISIFLAALGLFGLAALTAVNRTREIGIRKILGAPVVSIVSLISKDFLKLVLIALLIASPLAWYFMNRWLQDFAYRINIGLWVFIITGAGALLVALATIGIQAVKAACENPVVSLRSE